MPVSYTHLDVYKRQVYVSPELAEKIKKQIIASEELRRKHDLPYICLLYTSRCV